MYVTVELHALTDNGRTNSNGCTIRGMTDERSCGHERTTDDRMDVRTYSKGHTNG